MGYVFNSGILDTVCKELIPLDDPSEDAMPFVDEFTVFQPLVSYGE